MDRADLSQYATRWSIPKEVSGLQRNVTIGPCVYRRYPGTFVYYTNGDLEAYGLNKDGTWSKYGDAFESPEEAFEFLMSSAVDRQRFVPRQTTTIICRLCPAEVTVTEGESLDALNGWEFSAETGWLCPTDADVNRFATQGGFN